MKRYLILAISLLLLFSAGCSLLEKEDPTPTPVPGSDADPEPGSETTVATIVIKDFGTIELELYPDIAPQTVYNFVSLARQGFYDGLTFHRVISGFMIQGGDPNGNGSGGPGYVIKGEFSANGIENNLSHKRGVISMARRNMPYDSAGSQFFIVHEDNPASLDGKYAGFGMVTSGLDVVDAIAAVTTDANDKPTADVVIESITIEGPEYPEPEKLPAN